MRCTSHKTPSILTAKLQKHSVLPGVIQRMEAVMRGPFVKSPWSLTLAAFVTAKETHHDARSLQSWSLSRAQKPSPVCPCWENWWVGLTEIQQLKMFPVSGGAQFCGDRDSARKQPFFWNLILCLRDNSIYLHLKTFWKQKKTKKPAQIISFSHVFYRVIEQFWLQGTLKFI